MASEQEVDLGIKRGIFSSNVFTIQAFLFCGFNQESRGEKLHLSEAKAEVNEFMPIFELHLNIKHWKPFKDLHVSLRDRAVCCVCCDARSFVSSIEAHKCIIK